MNRITAVIPVRKGSTRCKNKNIRNFEDTSLLKLKIETLKKVKGIDIILVSSNCDVMLGIALDMGVDIYRRDDKFCTNENPGSFFCNLADSVKTDFMMHTPVTSPFISSDMYNKMIEYISDDYNKQIVEDYENEFEKISDKSKQIVFDYCEQLVDEES